MGEYSEYFTIIRQIWLDDTGVLPPDDIERFSHDINRLVVEAGWYVTGAATMVTLGNGIVLSQTLIKPSRREKMKPRFSPAAYIEPRLP